MNFLLFQPLGSDSRCCFYTGYLITICLQLCAILWANVQEIKQVTIKTAAFNISSFCCDCLTIEYNRDFISVLN